MTSLRCAKGGTGTFCRPPPSQAVLVCLITRNSTSRHPLLCFTPPQVWRRRSRGAPFASSSPPRPCSSALICWRASRPGSRTAPRDRARHSRRPGLQREAEPLRGTVRVTRGGRGDSGEKNRAAGPCASRAAAEASSGRAVGGGVQRARGGWWGACISLPPDPRTSRKAKL